MADVLVRNAKGNYIVVGTGGQRRPATGEDFEALEIPFADGSVNEEQQGVTALERFTAKNVTTDPAGMRSLLSKRYWVAPLDNEGGWNFAVKMKEFSEEGNLMPPDPEKPWTVVDPPGIKSIGDFFQDITDLLSDAVVGTVAGLGTAAGGALGAVGGPAGVVAGAALGGGLAGAGGEAARQMVGSFIGVPDNFSTGEVLLSGGLSAAIPVAGAGLRAAGRGIGTFARGTGKQAAALGGKVIGLTDKPGMDSAQQIIRASEKEFFRQLQDPTDLVGRLRAHLRNQVNEVFVETPARYAIIREGTEKGVKVQIRSAIQKALNIRDDTLGDEEAVSIATELIDRISNLIGKNVRNPVNLRNVKAVDPITAQRIKKNLAEATNRAGGFAGRVLKDRPTFPTKFVAAIKQAGKEIDRSMRSALDPLGKKTIEDAATGKVVRGTFSELNERLAEKIDLKNLFIRKFGDAAEGAEANILNLIGRGKGTFRNQVRRYDELWGTDFLRRMENTGVASEFARFPGASFGQVPLFPRFTATGQFLGPSLIGGGLGFTGGGPEGALTGAAIGAGLASPRTILGFTKLARAADRSTVKTLSRLGQIASAPGVSPAERAAAFVAFRNSLKRIVPQDRPVLREDSKRKELEGR
jgi:hypothetical protein